MFWLYEGSVGCLHWYVPQCHHCPNVWGLKSTRAENGSMMLKLLNVHSWLFKPKCFLDVTQRRNPPCFDLRCQFWLRLWRLKTWLGNLTFVWVFVNTYRCIFSGMNIHLPAILGFTRYQGFDPSPYVVKRCKAINHSRYPLGCCCFLRGISSEPLRVMLGNSECGRWPGRTGWVGQLGDFRSKTTENNGVQHGPAKVKRCYQQERNESGSCKLTTFNH